MAGDLYDQGMKNKNYAQQRKKAAGLVDPGLLTEPAKAAQRTRKEQPGSYQASHGDEYSAGTQGAEPKRFAKGGRVVNDHDADDEVENWAKKAKGGPIGPIKKGALHKEMGISQDKKIPAGRLKSAANSSNETLRERAQFAINAKKWKHADGGSIKNLESDESPSNPRNKLERVTLAKGGPVDAAERKDGNDIETGARKGPSNPEQKYAKGGDVKEPKKDSKPAPKSNLVPRNKVAKMAPPMPPAMAGPPPAMPPAPPPAAGGMPGFAVGGIAKIRHNQMTEGQKQKPGKPSGWNAYK